jgi:hypothetical protein
VETPEPLHAFGKNPPGLRELQTAGSWPAQKLAFLGIARRLSPVFVVGGGRSRYVVDHPSRPREVDEALLEVGMNERNVNPIANVETAIPPNDAALGGGT